MEMVELFKNKKILVLGLGKEGVSTLVWLSKEMPNNVLGAADQLSFKALSSQIKKVIKLFPKIRFHLGKEYLKAINQYDVIIRSPGFPLTLGELIRAKKQKKIITSQTKIFFDSCPGKIIGVTGTKGKGTTSSLIYHALKKNRLKVRLIGNIGKPALSFLPQAGEDDIFVFELSSHQLIDLKKSPHIAVVQNIVPEHLDYYKNFKEYVRAKKPIVCYQTKKDYLIYNAHYAMPSRFAQLSRAKKLPFNKKQCPGCHVEGGYLIYCNRKGVKEKIIKINEVPLEGRFNLQNVMPAIVIAKLFKISSPSIEQAVKNFKPLPHRLEKVGTFRGITFYNDSLATNPYATTAALDALGDKIGTIFLGGHERNLDLTQLAEKVAASRIENIILFPTTGKRIWQKIKARAKKRELKHFFAQSMEQGVKLAYQHTPRGRICLLSCASPSFGLFENYKERGDLFKEYVKELGKK